MPQLHQIVPIQRISNNRLFSPIRGWVTMKTSVRQ